MQFKFIYIFLLLSISSCGGGSGDSEQSPTQETSPPLEKVKALTASLPKVDWLQGSSFEQCVNVNQSNDSTEYSFLYGPKGMAIDAQGCITWAGKLTDFGQDYEINYAVTVKRGDLIEELASTVSVITETQPKQQAVSFLQSRNIEHLRHNNYFKRIKTQSGSEYALVSRRGKEYSIIRLNKDNQLLVEKVTPNLSDTQHIKSWGDYDNGEGVELLIFEENKGFFKLGFEDTIYPISTEWEHISLVDIIGDRTNEVLITESTDRDFYSIDFKFYQENELVYQSESVTHLMSAICDVDNDGIKEINANASIKSSTIKVSTGLVGYSDFIVDDNTGRCTDFISFPSDGISTSNLQSMEWYRIEQGERELISSQLIAKTEELKDFVIDDVFVGDLYYGNNPKLIYDNSNKIVSLIGYIKNPNSSSNAEFLTAVIINFNLNTNSISSNEVVFSTNLGITLKAEDKIIGLADLDADGIDELIYEHTLVPSDSMYFEFKNEENNLGVRVLAAANVLGNKITPKFISDLLPFGNEHVFYPKNVQYLESKQIIVSQNATKTTTDQSFNVISTHVDSSQITFDENFNIISSSIESDPLVPQECLAWDENCSFKVQLDASTRSLSVLDKVTEQKIFEVKNMPIVKSTAWTSYIDNNGKQKLILSNSEEFYIF